MRGMLLLSILLLATAPSQAGPGLDEVRVLMLEGSPYERGLTHGKTLKGEINALVRLWKADLSEQYKMDADEFIDKFLERTSFVEAIKKWTPELLDEVRGIADGGGVDFDTMLAFQLVDEYWVNGRAVAREHCSGLGVARRGGHPSIVAQNMDLEGFRQGFQVVLHIKQPGTNLEAYVATCAGLIAANGMNNRGIGVCVNTLSDLEHCRDGLPVACVVRGLLLQETEGAAIQFLRRVKHASGQNYIIGGPTSVYDFECSANRVVQFVPKEVDGVVYHTNHPLASDDLTPEAKGRLLKTVADKDHAGDSPTRLATLQTRLGVLKEAGVGPIKGILSSHDSGQHPVCRSYDSKDKSFTFECTIMVLADRPELHICPGPPDVMPFRVLTFPGLGE
jgi:isopenicillin-N N-acyltransferase like protein